MKYLIGLLFVMCTSCVVRGFDDSQMKNIVHTSKKDGCTESYLELATLVEADQQKAVSQEIRRHMIEFCNEMDGTK